MTRAFFTPAEIIAAGSSDLPSHIRGFNRMVTANGWRSDEALARKRKDADGRGGWEYHVSVLPENARLKLQLVHSSPANSNEGPKDQENRQSLWVTYEQLPASTKAKCKARLELLLSIESIKSALDCTYTVAIEQVSKDSGTSRSTLFEYRRTIAKIAREDWLAALAPNIKKPKDRAEVSPDAYEVLISDYLRPEAPAFSACFRRLARMAKSKNWTLPNERSLRRRLADDIDITVQKIAREGREKCRLLFPSQRRSVKDLHAMQAVNMDGHKFDVFVRWYDGRIVRPIGLALQDLHSRKFVALRLSDSENKETTRLAIGDVVEQFGIPDILTTDNGRAFASKWISGGIKNRFRFKVKEEEPQGLIAALGIELHWAIPGRGQSKPIERGFRDLAETISKHPACAGAYTGNRPDAKPENYGNAAIPIEEFKAICEQELAAHNAQDGRRTEMAKGRSFDEVFQQSLEKPSTIVRWPTEAQRALWLLAAEKITARRGSGEIHFMDNRYWSQELNAHAGQKVVVRFDPDNLHGGIKVYDLEDRLICDARCIDDVGFYDVSAARDQARDEAALLKALKEEQRARTKLSPAALGAMYTDGPLREKPKPTSPKIKRLATAAPKKVEQHVEEHEDFEQSFNKGLKLVSGGNG